MTMLQGPLGQRVRSAAGILLWIWGAALLCLATLDWALYPRFLHSLFFR